VLYLFWALAIVAAVTVLYRLLVIKKTVHDYETGLLYRNGRFVGRVGAGAHRLCRVWSELTVIDTRRLNLTVPGQEVLCADHVGVKISLVVTYQVVDVEKAVHSVENYRDGLYSAIQLALRSALWDMKLEEVLSGRSDLAGKLTPEVMHAAEALGLKVHTLGVKDIMMAGDLKKSYADVVMAQKKGLASLERVRAETASLRNLANAAKMLEDNPNLLNLRVLQTISEFGASSGNSVVFNAPANLAPTGSAPGENHGSSNARAPAQRKRKRK
jgi:regulator of protease activity HflC (stomatin/prohibitin superfamily)